MDRPIRPHLVLSIRLLARSLSDLTFALAQRQLFVEPVTLPAAGIIHRALFRSSLIRVVRIGLLRILWSLWSLTIALGRILWVSHCLS